MRFSAAHPHPQPDDALTNEDLFHYLEFMMIDISKIRAAAERANAGIESVLGVVHEQVRQLKAVSDQLAAANAASDPVAQAAVQADLDKLAEGLSAEADKIAADVVAPAKPAEPVVTPVTAAVDTTAPAPAG